MTEETVFWIPEDADVKFKAKYQTIPIDLYTDKESLDDLMERWLKSKTISFKLSTTDGIF